APRPESPNRRQSSHRRASAGHSAPSRVLRRSLPNSMRLSHLLITCILAMPLTLPAQVMPSRVISGQREGGGLTFGLSDGEPISTFIEHTRALGLSDEQVRTLMDIRRRLRRANAPFVQQMDSLRDVVGLPRETVGRMMQPDMEALQRFQRLSQPMVDSIRA